MNRLFAGCIFIVLIGACTPPMTAAHHQAAAEITAALGEPEAPIQSGVYRVIGFTADGETTSIADVVETAERPDFSEFFTVQFSPRFGTYATSVGPLSFHFFDGERLVAVMDLLEADGTTFQLAEVTRGGDAIDIIYHDCNNIPENYRLAQGITTETCEIESAETLLRAFGLMNLDELARIHFERYAPLPDFLR